MPKRGAAFLAAGLSNPTFGQNISWGPVKVTDHPSSEDYKYSPPSKQESRPYYNPDNPTKYSPKKIKGKDLYLPSSPLDRAQMVRTKSPKKSTKSPKKSLIKLNKIKEEIMVIQLQLKRLQNELQKIKENNYSPLVNKQSVLIQLQKNKINKEKSKLAEF